MVNINGYKWLMMVNNNLLGGWPTYPSEKYDFVNCDDDIPNIWKVIKIFQTTKQF